MNFNKIIVLAIIASLLISQASAGPFTYLACVAACGTAAGIITAVCYKTKKCQLLILHFVFQNRELEDPLLELPSLLWRLV